MRAILPDRPRPRVGGYRRSAGRSGRHIHAVDIAVEYKPDEPRTSALCPPVPRCKAASLACIGRMAMASVTAGTVHPFQTVKLFMASDRASHDGMIDLDTFPDQAGLTPVPAIRANIAPTDRLRHRKDPRNQRRACRHGLTDRGKRVLSSRLGFHLFLNIPAGGFCHCRARCVTSTHPTPRPSSWFRYRLRRLAT